VARGFRSPTAGSLEAATTPCKLACEAGGNVRWRTLPDGRLEVAVLRDDGRLERFLVDDDGRSTVLQAMRVPDTRAFWRFVCVSGFVLFLATFVVLAVTHADENTDPTVPVLMTLTGMGLATLGGIRKERVADVSTYLEKTGDRWHEPTNLGGWTPSTTEQLAAVESLANSHGGRVIVAHDGSEACVVGFRSFERYALDDSGACRLVERVTGMSQARRRFNELNRIEWHPILTKIEEDG